MPRLMTDDVWTNIVCYISHYMYYYTNKRVHTTYIALVLPFTESAATVRFSQLQVSYSLNGAVQPDLYITR